MFKVLAIFAFVPAIFAQTAVRSCDNGVPLPQAVWFESRENPCPAGPCDISRAGGAGVTHVDFTPTFDAATIMPQVRAFVFGISITQELPEDIRSNPCGILTKGSCPLPANAAAAYKLTLPVDPGTPLVATDTEITLFGNGNQPIFCYRLQTRVVD